MPHKLSLRSATVTLPELQKEVNNTEAVGFELIALMLTVRENEDINALIYRPVERAPVPLTLHEFDASDDEALQKTASAQVSAAGATIIAEGILGVNGREIYALATRPAAAPVGPTEPTDPTEPTEPIKPVVTPLRDLFGKLAAAYAAETNVAPQLKAVTLAQWALESGRGTSELSIQYFNFGGLKWRKEMAGFATPVAYLAHDGKTEYCKFSSVDDFIKGYWQFLTRAPYQGWKAHTASGEKFLRFIGPIYCPDGGYVNEVLDLVPEAESLLEGAGNVGGGGGGTFKKAVTPDLTERIKNLPASGVAGIVVLDPGHGGTQKVGGSSPNNAISASGIKEKTIVLELALLVRDALRKLAPNVKVVMTRENDQNVGISARAQVAAAHRADLFLSFHFNGYNGRSRGVETWVRSAGNGNVNVAEDRGFAGKIQTAVLQALRRHDPATPDRGIKEDDEREAPLGVLNEQSLGNSSGRHPTRACLVELEFIDVPSVDALMNTGPKAATVRADICAGIASAIVAELT